MNKQRLFLKYKRRGKETGNIFHLILIDSNALMNETDQPTEQGPPLLNLQQPLKHLNSKEFLTQLCPPPTKPIHIRVECRELLVFIIIHTHTPFRKIITLCATSV